ncbi:unnamed protein product [Rotaria magnacalcarata]|uniref:Uncharacterized protein n=1 Tax=Rotaria magnacalcarata TaxID=392030 RepID=A0A8S2PZ83_9BILA|nr:unnamed protein product [Rotaria magnacalcarata]CAF4076179.1 unnamed protein product [Rotaria magnacalcarata]
MGITALLVFFLTNARSVTTTLTTTTSTTSTSTTSTTTTTSFISSTSSTCNDHIHFMSSRKNVKIKLGIAIEYNRVSDSSGCMKTRKEIQF